MARRRKTKPRRHGEVDPEDVLAGREDVRAEELFRLIHRANPTGRGISRREEERLYEQKSRLQSLLVRRFSELVVVRPAADDGVVSLAHRSGFADACHAVVSRLDPDARAWVRRELDVAAAPEVAEELVTLPAAERPDAEPASVEELVARARSALRDYEYEAAERDLKLAVERGAGGPEAAVPLLELWVDVLGTDEEALALEPRLAARTREHPKARALLALAAARRGDERHALSLVKGLEAPRAADVYAALAAGAIRAGETQTAGRYVGEVAALDPAHPEIANLRLALDELRAASRRPAEDALARRCEREGPLAVEGEARAFSEEWGESEVARRILRQAAELRRRREIEEEIELGEGALFEERFDDAARHLQKALDAGCEREDLPRLIETARTNAAERDAAERSAAVVARFADDPRGALLAFLGFPADLRERVRREIDRPVLGWLEEVAAPPSGGKAQAAVTAVLALERAVAALAGGDAEAAQDVLSPHAGALGDVPEAERCLGEAAARLAAARRRRARERLAAAGESFDAGRLEEARQLLTGLALGELEDEGRSRAGELDQRLGRAERRQSLERGLDRHLAADDFLGALDRARTLAEESASDGERRRWDERLRDLRQRLWSAWRLEVERGRFPQRESRGFSLTDRRDLAQVWLDDDGKELLLADSRERWLFLHAVDLEDTGRGARVSLRTPEPLGSSVTAFVDGERLWLIGERGGVLEMARDGWEILSWRSLQEHVPEGFEFDEASLLPASPYVWVQYRGQRASLGTSSYVVDRRSWRRIRSFPESCSFLPILGPEPCVVNHAYACEPRFYSPRGSVHPTLGFSQSRLTGAAPFPLAGSEEKTGVLGATCRAFREDEGESFWSEEEGMDVWVISPTSPGELRVLTVDDIDPERGTAFASDLERGIGFVLAHTYKGETELLAFVPSEGKVELLYRMRFPVGSVLAQDRRSRRVVAVFQDTEGLQVQPLGSEPPPAEIVDRAWAWRTPGESKIPELEAPLPCGLAAITRRQVPGVNDPDRERDLDDFEKDRAEDVDLLVHQCRGLWRTGCDKSAWASRVRRLAERHPEHAGAALLLAELEAEAGKWEEVHGALAGVDPSSLGKDDKARHFHHLLGLALLHLDRPDEANLAFGKGLLHEGSGCFLRVLLELTQPMSDPPEAHEWGANLPVARQLLGAIRSADRALERGDPAAARPVIDCPAVWTAGEVQSAARLAELFLRWDLPGGRFLKRLALAGFLKARQAGDVPRKELKLPGLAWDGVRLDEVEERARSWLEESPGGVARSSSENR